MNHEPHPTNHEELISCLQLINSDSIGPITFYKLIRSFGSAQSALASLKQEIFPREKAERELEAAHQKGVHILTFTNPDYPQKLKEIRDAPPILYVLGTPKLLNHPQSLSIVGARNASILGRKTASRIAYDLTNNNVLIVSGLARGIDAAAHKGALYALDQSGPTVAVLGTGVDIPYPEENRNLYEQIKCQGAIVSEFPLGTTPQANNFPRRNRIIAGLTCGTLVVEAAAKSGSLITSRFAREQNRHIFAIPGSPQDARALGPNQLIKNGAVLVDNYQDIINILSTAPIKNLKTLVDKPPRPVARGDKRTALKLEEPIPRKASDLLDMLNTSGTHIDELVRETGLDSTTLSLRLLELELSGCIERQPGNIIVKIKK